MATTLPRSALRHVVAIERKDSSPLDTHGQRAGKWYTWRAMIPTEITTLSGRDLELARRTFAEATHRVRFDYVKGLEPAESGGARHQLRFRGRTLHILHIDDVDMAGVTHVLTVAERT